MAMQDEEAEQRVTYLLQEIDANICAAHRSATQICATARRHHQLLRQIHEAAQVWRPLFASFSAVQPAARRPAPPATPRASFIDASAAAGGGDDDADDDSRSLALESASTGSGFKTTTLEAPPSASRADASADSSLMSVHEPRLTETPLLPQGPPASSDVSSESKTEWSPRASPLRSGALAVRPRTPPPSAPATGTDVYCAAGWEQGPNRFTPGSAISSVAPFNSPGVSKNLMKMGAFELSPLRERESVGKQPARYREEEDSSLSSLSPPELSTVVAMEPMSVQQRRASQAVERQQSAAKGDQSPPGSGRKRKRVNSPVYPKAQHPVSSTKPSYSNLRRKYSNADYSTPTKKRGRPESQPTPAKTPLQQAIAAFDDDDEPPTPDFDDITSPLLRTKLKVVTPHTPLSNRIVGANLDIGSVSQESILQDYDDSFTSGKPAPQFELALLPPAFRVRLCFRIAFSNS